MPRIIVPAQADEKKAPEMREFKLRSDVGSHTGRDKDGNLVAYDPGEMVPLTQAQHESFADKFEGSWTDGEEVDTSLDDSSGGSGQQPKGGGSPQAGKKPDQQSPLKPV
jgi:hypothetical protein